MWLCVAACAQEVGVPHTAMTRRIRIKLISNLLSQEQDSSCALKRRPFHMRSHKHVQGFFMLKLGTKMTLVESCSVVKQQSAKRVLICRKLCWTFADPRGRGCCCCWALVFPHGYSDMDISVGVQRRAFVLDLVSCLSTFQWHSQKHTGGLCFTPPQCETWEHLMWITF